MVLLLCHTSEPLQNAWQSIQTCSINIVAQDKPNLINWYNYIKLLAANFHLEKLMQSDFEKYLKFLKMHHYFYSVVQSCSLLQSIPRNQCCGHENY